MRKPVLKSYYGGIFFEFVLQDHTADAIIILPSFPGRNDFNELISLFYERGYHVFVPRYRGTYQSSGKFLSKNPIDDLGMFMKNLNKGHAKSLWDMKKQTFRINKKILLADSFGGPIACGLAAKYPLFSHILLIAPIWDFSKHNEKGDELDINHMSSFVQRAYQNLYRFEFTNITEKLKKFKELSPEYYIPRLEIPVLVMHDPNDKTVAFSHTKDMLSKLKNITYIEHYLGHGVSEPLLNAYWVGIDKFIKVNYLG